MLVLIDDLLPSGFPTNGVRSDVPPVVRVFASDFGEIHPSSLKFCDGINRNGPELAEARRLDVLAAPVAIILAIPNERSIEIIRAYIWARQTPAQLTHILWIIDEEDGTSCDAFASEELCRSMLDLSERNTLVSLGTSDDQSQEQGLQFLAALSSRLSRLVENYIVPRPEGTEDPFAWSQPGEFTAWLHSKASVGREYESHEIRSVLVTDPICPPRFFPIAHQCQVMLAAPENTPGQVLDDLDRAFGRLLPEDCSIEYRASPHDAEWIYVDAILSIGADKVVSEFGVELEEEISPPVMKVAPTSRGTGLSPIKRTSLWSTIAVIVLLFLSYPGLSDGLAYRSQPAPNLAAEYFGRSDLASVVFRIIATRPSGFDPYDREIDSAVLQSQARGRAATLNKVIVGDRLYAKGDEFVLRNANSINQVLGGATNQIGAALVRTELPRIIGQGPVGDEFPFTQRSRALTDENSWEAAVLKNIGSTNGNAGDAATNDLFSGLRVAARDPNLDVEDLVGGIKVAGENRSVKNWYRAYLEGEFKSGGVSNGALASMAELFLAFPRPDPGVLLPIEESSKWEVISRIDPYELSFEEAALDPLIEYFSEAEDAQDHVLDRNPRLLAKLLVMGLASQSDEVQSASRAGLKRVVSTGTDYRLLSQVLASLPGYLGSNELSDPSYAEDAVLSILFELALSNDPNGDPSSIASAFSTLCKIDLVECERFFVEYARRPQANRPHLKSFVVALANEESGLATKERVEFAFAGDRGPSIPLSVDVLGERLRSVAMYQRLSGREYVGTPKLLPPKPPEEADYQEPNAADWYRFANRFPWFPGADDAVYRAMFAEYSGGVSRSAGDSQSIPMLPVGDQDAWRLIRAMARLALARSINGFGGLSSDELASIRLDFELVYAPFERVGMDSGDCRLRSRFVKNFSDNFREAQLISFCRASLSLLKAIEDGKIDEQGIENVLDEWDDLGLGSHLDPLDSIAHPKEIDPNLVANFTDRFCVAGRANISRLPGRVRTESSRILLAKLAKGLDGHFGSCRPRKSVWEGR